MKLAVKHLGRSTKKNVQYDTGMSLSERLSIISKFVVRENQTGQMGSFETDIEGAGLKIATTKDELGGVGQPDSTDKKELKA